MTFPAQCSTITNIPKFFATYRFFNRCYLKVIKYLVKWINVVGFNYYLITFFTSSSVMSELSLKDPIEEDFKDSSDITLIQKYLIFVSIEMIWLLFGLMTNSWKLYLITLLSSFLIGQIIKRLGNLTIITFLTRFISIFRFCITLFLIINHFHLHIDLIEWIKLIH